MTTRQKLKTPRPKAARKPRPPQDKASDWRWADPNTLKVHPPFEAMIPLQSRGEYLALSESIKSEGCRDPVLVWKGRNVLLDGHTRRALCIEHGKKVKAREVELPDEHAAAEYILRLQSQRRNLTPEAVSYLRGAEYNAVKKGWGGHRPSPKGRGRSDRLPRTADRLAEKHGVSEKTIKRDGRFAQAIDRLVAAHGEPEVKRRLLGADVHLTRQAVRQMGRMEPEELKAAVTHLLEEGGLPRRKGRPKKSTPDQAARSILARLEGRGRDHARSVVRRLAKLLGLEVAVGAAEE